MMEKGFFPHLFNTLENYDYVGALPDRKYFDLAFSLKDEKDFKEFNEWYDSWEGRIDWCFMDELQKYCINDVVCLVGVMKKYHDILMAKCKITPWHNTTAPSFVHEYYTRTLSSELDLPNPKDDEELYQRLIFDMAKKTHWAVLKETEYWFARKALRGGRTDIRKVYHDISDEDWRRGVHIRYQDICSQYPYQQAVHDFPTGTPIIHCWDEREAPCQKHKKGGCVCVTGPFLDPSVDVKMNPPLPTREQLEKDDFWFGIVCASVTPPTNLYHPVLVHFDEELGKCVASCKPIIRGHFTSIEFKKALEMGYVIDELHRFDVYNKKPSLWEETIKTFYIEKMVNSGNLPGEDEQEDLITEYEKRFLMGPDLQKTFLEERWGKNPAMKRTFKIMLNSGWGKHCQRPFMGESVVWDEELQQDAVNEFFQNCISDQYQFQESIPLGHRTMYRYIKNDSTSKVDLHQSYLPAALFVPAYGRLHLWEQLNKLGKRVLMNDTDSIIYIYDPELGEEGNIPEGSIWGDWEREDIDKLHEGIRTFVGLGPKSYALKCGDGETLVKVKGISLKRATEDLVNFEVMENLVLDHFTPYTGTDEDWVPLSVQVPQKNFTYRFGRGITTHLMLKELKFNYETLKGELQPDGCLNPFGYSE